ncbi:flagellar motor protein MotB [Sphingomonas sp. 1P08PE]|uniref:flagellar motor protein MotB n=1 Tax=Sphingomonas sp. 1P08PE TaxID=554122 RepID=UPI00399FCCF0
MTADWPEPVQSRPLWLVTLADLALLMVGFFVLIQASRVEPTSLARSLRSGFTELKPVETPMPVAANRLDGFASGSAALPGGSAAIVDWAREELRDPRVQLTVTGSADAATGDVDPATGSAAILAADRARAVAVDLAALAPARIAVATATGPRAVTITLAFAGEPVRTPQ